MLYFGWKLVECCKIFFFKNFNVLITTRKLNTSKQYSHNVVITYSYYLGLDSHFGQKQQFEVKNVLMIDLFLTNTQLLASQDINWCTGVVWIIVMFLSAVWTLILTAPIHCRGKWWNATFLQIWWRNKFIYILDGLRVSTFSSNFHFGLN